MRNSDPPATREEMEQKFRQLIETHDLPEPDAIEPHEDGGIVCLWNERKVAVIIDPGD